MLKRRRFIQTLAGSAALASPAVAQSNLQLDLVSIWDPKTSLYGASAQRIVNRVSVATDRRITVNLSVADPSIGVALHDQVSAGDVDLYHAHEGMWAPKSKGYDFFHSVPLGLNAEEHASWLYFFGGQYLWDDLAFESGIKPLPAGLFGASMGGWAGTNVQNLTDLQGQAVHANGQWAQVLSSVGANVISGTDEEAAARIKSGDVALAYLGEASDAVMAELETGASYLVSPSMDQPTRCLSVGFNLARWEGLDAGDRSLLETCIQAENDLMLSRANFNSAMSLNRFIAAGGTQITYSDDVKSALVAAVIAQQTQIGQSTSIVGDIYQSFHDMRSAVSSWTANSDGEYVAARREALS